MKIGIYSAINVGSVKDPSLLYIAVDHGVTHLINQNIKPTLAIGDFDSLVNHSLLNDLNITKLPTIKDVTDTHAAIDYAIENGYDEIDLYGVTGKRVDHFMAVMCLLKKYQEVHITVYDQYNKITILKQGKHIVNNDYKYFSLFSLDEANIKIEGAHYNIDHYRLCNDDPLCVSNQTDHKAVITCDRPIMLIQSND